MCIRDRLDGVGIDGLGHFGVDLLDGGDDGDLGVLLAQGVEEMCIRDRLKVKTVRAFLFTPFRMSEHSIR